MDIKRQSESERAAATITAILQTVREIYPDTPAYADLTPMMKEHLSYIWLRYYAPEMFGER